jgi:hypothetical protein
MTYFDNTPYLKTLQSNGAAKSNNRGTIMFFVIYSIASTVTLITVYQRLEKSKQQISILKSYPNGGISNTETL